MNLPALINLRHSKTLLGRKLNVVALPRHHGMSVVREVMAEFRAMRRVEEALDANRFLGTCVRVLRNVERSDFPDIDQMLQDLQGLPSPDDPLYEVSLSHG